MKKDTLILVKEDRQLASRSDVAASDLICPLEAEVLGDQECSASFQLDTQFA